MSLDEIKSILIKRSMELWEKQLRENAVIKEGKMRTYYKFKTIFKKEIYLNVIGNRDIRKSFTQFRVSAHALSIEKGRHINIKLENRTCKNCQSLEIEDEFHILITCPQYIAEREILFSYIAKYCINFKNLSDQNKFVWLMTTEDTNIIQKNRILCSYMLWNKETKYLSNHFKYVTFISLSIIRMLGIFITFSS